MRYSVSLTLLIAIAILWLAMASPLSASMPAARVNDTRIITTDWTIAESLVALQAPLIGVGDKREYQRWVIEPVIDNQVVDIGLRAQPNLTLLNGLGANLLLTSSWMRGLLPATPPNMTIKTVDFYTAQGIDWPQALARTRQLAQLVERNAEAEALIAKVQTQFAQDQQRLHAYQAYHYAIVQFIDARHLRIYAANSLYGVVLEQLGLTNGWTGDGNAWGFNQITLLELARLPANTLLIVVQPYPVNVPIALANNALWQALPFSRPAQLRTLPAVWGFGALPSMQRFSQLLSRALLSPQAQPWETLDETD